MASISEVAKRRLERLKKQTPPEKPKPKGFKDKAVAILKRKPMDRDRYPGSEE